MFVINYFHRAPWIPGRQNYSKRKPKNRRFGQKGHHPTSVRRPFLPWVLQSCPQRGSRAFQSPLLLSLSPLRLRLLLHNPETGSTLIETGLTCNQFSFNCCRCLAIYCHVLLYLASVEISVCPFLFLFHSLLRSAGIKSSQYFQCLFPCLVDGWMDEWLNEWANEWMIEWMNERMNNQMEVWMDEVMIR